MKRNRFAFLLFVTSLLFLPVFVSAQAVISALPVGDENLAQKESDLTFLSAK